LALQHMPEPAHDKEAAGEERDAEPADTEKGEVVLPH